MKLKSIITLLIFLNFTALPGIAAICGWEIQQTNVVINEEENHSASFVVYEKALPKTLDIHDFLKFFESDSQNKNICTHLESSPLSAYLPIFSPPPEA